MLGSTLTLVGLVIALLMSLGTFLDSQHLENKTKEKVRSYLIQFYIVLYELPKRLYPLLSEYLDRLHDPPEVNVFTGEVKTKKRSWYLRAYYLLFVPAFSISFAFLIMFTKKDPQMENLVAWLWGFWGGVTLSLMGRLFLAGVLILNSVVPFALGFAALMLLEAMRRVALVVLNKSTDPKTSPFSYLAGLLSVVTALVGVVKYLLVGEATS